MLILKIKYKNIPEREQKEQKEREIRHDLESNSLCLFSELPRRTIFQDPSNEDTRYYMKIHHSHLVEVRQDNDGLWQEIGDARIITITPQKIKSLVRVVEAPKYNKGEKHFFEDMPVGSFFQDQEGDQSVLYRKQTFNTFVTYEVRDNRWMPTDQERKFLDKEKKTVFTIAQATALNEPVREIAEKNEYELKYVPKNAVFKFVEDVDLSDSVIASKANPPYYFLNSGQGLAVHVFFETGMFRSSKWKKGATIETTKYFDQKVFIYTLPEKK